MSNDPTIELISHALDAALMRQTAIANNVANANTPGYHSIEVNFEQQLHELSLETPSRNVEAFYQESDNFLSLDDQMALSVKNATQFRALVKGLNHKLAIMKLAVGGNTSS